MMKVLEKLPDCMLPDGGDPCEAYTELYEYAKGLLDRSSLADDLTKAFINYQHRLDCPMPSATESPEAVRLKYMKDSLFHAKVDSLVGGVLHILDKYIP